MPGAELIGPARLPGYRLVFRGVADVVPCPERRCVLGTLWNLTPACERSLNRFEGYPRFYGKREGVLVEGPQGQVSAMIYYMEGNPPIASPVAGYLEGIREGYWEAGHEEGPLEVALNEADVYSGGLPPLAPAPATGQAGQPREGAFVETRCRRGRARTYVFHGDRFIDPVTGASAQEDGVDVVAWDYAAGAGA